MFARNISQFDVVIFVSRYHHVYDELKSFVDNCCALGTYNKLQEGTMFFLTQSEYDSFCIDSYGKTISPDDLNA